MIRLTKQTDYAIVLLARIANHSAELTHNARDLAQETHIPLPMVGKILKALTRHRLLVSHRGTKGGYALARPAESVSIAEVITALEGPIAMTECVEQRSPCGCMVEPSCPVKTNWQLINEAIRGALANISLSAMAQPIPLRSETVGCQCHSAGLKANDDLKLVDQLSGRDIEAPKDFLSEPGQEQEQEIKS